MGSTLMGVTFLYKIQSILYIHINTCTNIYVYIERERILDKKLMEKIPPTDHSIPIRTQWEAIFLSYIIEGDTRFYKKQLVQEKNYQIMR